MLKTLSTSTERVAGAGAGCYLDTGGGHMLLVTGLHCYCHVSRVTRHIAARCRPAHCRLATEPQLTLALLRWRHRRGQPSAVRRDAGSRAPRTAYAGMQVLCSVEAYTYNRDFWGCFSEHHNQCENISHFCARLRMTPIYLFCFIEVKGRNGQSLKPNSFKNNCGFYFGSWSQELHCHDIYISFKFSKRARDIDANYNAAQLVRESHCTGCGDTEPEQGGCNCGVGPISRSSRRVLTHYLYLCLIGWTQLDPDTGRY